MLQDEVRELQKSEKVVNKSNAKKRDAKAQILILEKEISTIKKKYKKVKKERDHFKRKYKNVIESKSWRYTQPLRNLRALFTYKHKNNKNILVKEVIPSSNLINNSTEKISPTDKKINMNTEKSDYQKKVDRLKRKLFDLGFEERPLKELTKMVEDKTNPELRSLAARELALWYANQRTLEGAYNCLKYLTIVLENEKDADIIRQSTVLAVECYERLGNIEEGKDVIKKALAFGPDANLYLAASNLETSMNEKIKLINKAMSLYEIPEIFLTGGSNTLPYDQLSVKITKNHDIGYKLDEMPKITVIMPCYNAQDTISTAIESVLNQTWTNLELIVVDDCSTDNTVSVVEKYVEKDKRVKLLVTETNGGPYVARNLATTVATGDFITCNDADDWSHPCKLEIQVKHLLANPSVIANTSQQARATSDLQFYRRGNYGNYIFLNVSSLMYRVKPVLEKVGYLQCVRFGADNEFVRRLRKVFGKESVVDLQTGPLSFQRQSSGSLTGNSAFGYHGFLMGARKEYYEAQTYFHSKEQNLRYEFPQMKQPFAVPEPMWPKRESNIINRREFDYIYITDFRKDTGNTEEIVKDIVNLRNQGYKIGLVQMSLYNFSPMKKMAPEIRDLVDGNQIQIVVYGEKVVAKSTIIRDPRVLDEWQRYIPDIEVGNLIVLVNKASIVNKEKKVVKFNKKVKQWSVNLLKYFGTTGKWYLTSEDVEQCFREYNMKELNKIKYATENFTYNFLRNK